MGSIALILCHGFHFFFTLICCENSCHEIENAQHQNCQNIHVA